MVGLDTNVLIRYIVQDDPVQSPLATTFIEKHCSVVRPGWIDNFVLCELVWVMDSAYEFERATVSLVLARLLSTTELEVENSDLAWAALRAFESGNADFSDYLIGLRNRRNGCRSTFTFDKRAARSEWHCLISA